MRVPYFFIRSFSYEIQISTGAGVNNGCLRYKCSRRHCYNGWSEDLGDDDPISKGKLQTYLKEENVELNKYFIAKSACEIFNQKLLLDKCRLFPITRFDPKNVDQNTHKMLLHITRIDVGSDAIGRMANGQSYAGGAVISGYIEIIDAYTDTLCCIIVVDRVSGLGSKFPNVRIRYAVEELISNQLFHIKKFDD